MAEKENEPYKLSAKQLIDNNASRKILKCSLSSDIGLGGGVPLGSTMIVGGKAKTGKTTVTLQYAAYGQNVFGTKVFYKNIEGRLSKLVLSQIRGLKLGENDFEVTMPPTIRDKQDNIIGYKKMAAEYWWKDIGDTIENNPKSIIIVDSISALSSEKEVSEGMGFQGRGDLQKLEAQFCRKYGDLVVPSEVTLFLLAQMQANTSGYGEATQIKCGNAIKHGADGIMFFKGTEKWKPENNRVLGHHILCRIDCSPLGPPFIETKIPLRYSYGVDDLQDILTHSINWEIIKQTGAWYTMPFLEKEKGKYQFIDLSTLKEDDKTIKPLRFQGEAQIRNYIKIRV